MKGKRFSGRFYFISGILFLAAFTLGGCQTLSVYLYSDNYIPRISPDLGIYNNKSIVLKDVVNKTANSSRRYFSAPDNSVYYYVPKHYLGPYGSAPDMAIFFKKVILKAFDELGIIVPDGEQANTKTPALEFTLLTITDEKFHFQCTLYYSNRPVFKKNYIVTEPRPGEDGRISVTVMEKRAYKMIDRLVQSVLNDLEFKKAYSRLTFRP